MQVNQHEVELKDAISNLETGLLTPVVAGELVSWVTTVQDAADELEERMRNFAEQVLHPQFKEIAKADNELLSRVQTMKEEEAKLLAAHEEFRSNLHLLAQRAPQVLSDEAKVADERAQVEKQGMKLMTELKRQQLAAATWLEESVYRDRGPVD